ncbi:lyase family protein [Erythrobacter sp. F6033]|uniref:lyase family protein n=1 Tax=Erythrobacter sp. F6033 TaxID=2926401 RepID=UPI001FF1CED4|nr:lyase family protein [Erythrobacter sp. F6033]MCK0127613.1 lyase family protein [Erythrobacter sp. F6033]
MTSKAVLQMTALAVGLIAAPVSAADCRVAPVQALFEYEAQTQTILDVEAAMARAQARHGVIPTEAAEDITRKARAELVRQAEFDAAYGVVRHRMVALLQVWREGLDDAGDQYVHFGATTVDIYGTATILQIDQAIAQMDACLADTIATMATLANDHKSTPMIGRTLGQHAQPITFGKKVSAWIGEYSRHRDRLNELRKRVRKSAALKGPVGNYSGLGDKAIAVERSFAAELGLDEPYLSDWNGTRDVIAEYGLILGLIARSHQRIGQELFLLQGTDIGEVREAQSTGVVGSSSMPHKRNPRAPERLIHAGRTVPRLAEVLSDDVVNFFERDNTSRLSPVIEEISVTSVDAVRRLNNLLGGLEVDAVQMRTNIDRTRGFAMSQSIAFALAEHMPREEAEAITKAVVANALAADTGFLEALLKEPQVTQHFDRDALLKLLDPAIIGAPAIEQVERIVSDAQGEGADQ